MVAPIALYPDPLLSEVLMASTYPLEVVEAYRWRQDPANANLQGDQLEAALEQQPWDPSVKSLTSSPQVLKIMNDNLQWTEQLGDAFLAQQGGVMDSVQRLRGRAQSDGALKTTPQQVVSTQGPDVVIEPAEQDVMYVPSYNPVVVYGPWMWPGYPPYYFPGYAYPAFGLGFGFSFAAFGPLWGWNHWDWYNHRIDIDNNRWVALNRGRAAPGSSGFWQHDPDHRRGVPYRSAAVRSRFGSALTAEARRNYRGYGPAAMARSSAIHTPTATSAAFHENRMTTPERSSTEHIPTAASPSRSTAMTRSNSTVMDRQTSSPATSRPSYTSPLHTSSYATPQRSVPAFESYSRGADVREQSARGAFSRSTMSSYYGGGSAFHGAPSGGAAGGGHSSGGNDRNR
jgi:hypothetical protein